MLTLLSGVPALEGEENPATDESSTSCELLAIRAKASFRLEVVIPVMDGGRGALNNLSEKFGVEVAVPLSSPGYLKRRIRSAGVGVNSGTIMLDEGLLMKLCLVVKDGVGGAPCPFL